MAVSKNQGEVFSLVIPTAGLRCDKWGELYALHAADGARFAYILTGDRRLAEELVQEAFIRVIARFQDRRDPSSLQAYLRRTMVNLSRSRARRLRVERSYIQEERHRVRAAITEFPDVEVHESLWQSLLRLPRRPRAAVFLRYYCDMSDAQIAEILGCSQGAVKSLVLRGMKKLRAEWKGEER